MTTTTRTTRTTRAARPAAARHASPRRAPDGWQEQWFAAIQRLQQPVVQTTARLAGRLADVLPERPARFGNLPKLQPAIHDALDAGLGLRARLVDEQAAFARSMMAALDPMVGKLDVVHAAHASPATHEQPQRAPRVAKEPHAA